ncbi:uncharacterized protein LOC112045250 isoform X2 [Bicyclus anynana]|uniref:Uncharacterized protein LOC112045250 isoform X2 n=1 Tax=Bicyclus anynana TaxID=110368 RepID=A0A6J1MNK9_BICAN|nr:uncharacterized protein LOC112045250 isoform X2 [Bicyclus anynana]
MEAQKLKKKSTLSKSKIKKTIKNVICRPDPVFWPVITETEKTVLQTALQKHRVHITPFIKPHWNDIKLKPKKERPQPPPIQKVEGLFFGISTCCSAVKTQDCCAVLVEADVNPQAIVHPVIEACISSNVSIICLKGLRQLSLSYFGLKTSCLGVKNNCLPDLSCQIHEIFKNYKQDTKLTPSVTCAENNTENVVSSEKVDDSKMDVDTYCPYVYRTDKKTRAFNPTDSQQDTKGNQFTGQQFIKLPQDNTNSSKPANDRKAYMAMMLKRIANNPNRVKKAKS